MRPVTSADVDDALREASSALAVTAGYAETVALVARIAVDRIAAFCIVDIVEDGTLTRRAAVTANAEPVAATQAPHPDAAEGVAAALRAAQTVQYAPSWFAALRRDDDGLAVLADDRIAAISVTPLLWDRRPMGTITLGFAHDAQQPQRDRLENFAQQAAIAIASARLVEDARLAHQQAEQARARLAYVSRTSSVFARSFDRPETLRRFAGSMIGAFADGAYVFVIADETLPVERYRAGSGADDAAEDVALRAMRTVRTVLDAGGRTIAAPLLTGGRVGGALAFTRAAERPAFSVDDLTLAEELAARTALFVETSRAYSRQRQVAETLQTAFRPRELPRIPGLQFASAYRPGTADLDVGGDWYDVVATDEDRVAFVIGDVMGHGIDAAAVMAELRSGLRAHLYTNCAPGACLGYVDTLLARDRGREVFATVVLMVYDRQTRMLTVANAGHPTPYLRRAAGSLVELAGPSLLLGLDGGPRAESTHAIAPGDVIVAYTDGVVEDRTREYDDGIAALERILRAPMRELGDVLERLLGLAPTSPDDRTLLAIRAE